VSHLARLGLHLIYSQTVAVARRRVLVLLAVSAVLASAALEAHGVAPRDARLLETIDGIAIAPLMYLGAKHMVTGYDHLLFLAGVVFYLYRLKHIVIYVSLFTLGHSVTLLAGAIGGLRVNASIIDAIIGLSIVYKAFENLGGFRRLGLEPDPRAAVLVFGLFHGFGLATKLQDLALSRNGLVVNILSFNVGVEIGQAVALTVVLGILLLWRTSSSYARHAFAVNTALMTGGFVLMGYHAAGYLVGGS
jgi:hypothetical protein